MAIKKAETDHGTTTAVSARAHHCRGRQGGCLGAVHEETELDHPRYITGKWGAISFAKGFDFSGKKKNQVGWADQNVFDTFYTQFYEGQR